MTTSYKREQMQRGERRAHYLVGLQWHAGAFFIINAFFWLMDIGLGQEGVQWAYWIAIPWAVALAFHALAYLIVGRQIEERKARDFARKEQDQAGSRS